MAIQPIGINHKAANYRGTATVHTVVVRLMSEGLQDEVYRARTMLKTHNAKHCDCQIYINEDLTRTEISWRRTFAS